MNNHVDLFVGLGLGIPLGASGAVIAIGVALGYGLFRLVSRKRSKSTVGSDAVPATGRSKEQTGPRIRLWDGSLSNTAPYDQPPRNLED